jgi:hypothetical protein
VPAPAPAPAPTPLATPVALPSPEQRAPQFGDKGQIVLSDLLGASLGFLSYANGPVSSSSVGIEPAFDYFLAHNVSLGASAFVRYSHGTSAIETMTSTLGYGLTARVGGNVPLGRLISFRPFVGLSVWTEHTSYDAPNSGYTTSIGGTAIEAGQSVDETVVVVNLFAPILVHPTAHFFVGLGPAIYQDLSHSTGSLNNKRTFFGADSIVGGWF